MGSFHTNAATERMNPKDSLLKQQPNPLPNVLFEIMVRNRQQQQHVKTVIRHNTATTMKRQNVDSDDNVVCDGPFDPALNWLIESYTHPNTQSNYANIRRCESRRYRSSPRPIIRCEQETLKLRMEERAIHAAETEYDQATWRMYNRIMRYRQTHPIPDDDETNAICSNDHVPASDTTATTTSGTNSTCSSRSNSPKFVPILHSSKKRDIPKDEEEDNDVDTLFEVSGLPRMISNDSDRFMLNNQHDDYDFDDEERFEYDDYSEMIMQDIEL